MATTIQNLHSLTAGNQPGDLMPGEIAYNVADGFVYLGNGSNAYTDTLGQQVGTPVAPGMGWQQAIFNAAPINGAVTLAGIYDAQDNLITSVTAAGTAAGFTVGALPAAAAGNEGYYVLVQIGGVLAPPAPAETAAPGDWLVSSGTGWALVAESSVVIPASNVNIVPTGDFTGPSMQDVLNQIQLLYVTIADGVMSQLQCNGNATLGNADTDTLTVNATSSFTAPITASGTVQVGGAFTANSTGYVVGNFRVDGAIDARGNVSLGNASTDTVTVAGPITANNNLTVAGVTQLNGSIQASGALTTANTVNIGAAAGGLNISSTTVFGNNVGVTFNTGSRIDCNGTYLASSANTSFYLQGNANFNAGLNNKIITYARPKDPQTGAVGAVVNENLNNFLVIPGTIIAFGRSGFTPNGYLWCDGASVSKNAYPDLFAAIQYVWGGSGDFFNVPNLLGLFLRGYGASANPNVKTSSGGTPNGGNVGSVSTDSFGTHSHAFQVNTFGYQAAFSTQRECLGLATNQMNSQGRPNNGTLTLETGGGGGVPVQNSGTTENKPVSASVAYFIKY